MSELQSFEEVAAGATKVRALAPVVVDSAALPLEEDREGGFGTVRWRTLICADRTPSDEMVLGVAEFGPGDRLEPHRHSPPEFYFGLSGEGTVWIEGETHRIAPGVAIYIPPRAEHAVEAGAEGLRFAYGFPRARFIDVDYSFSAMVQGD